MRRICLSALLSFVTVSLLLLAIPAAAQQSPTEPAKVEKYKSTPGGVEYSDLKVGEGKEAGKYSTVTVHYVGWLVNGRKFDSSFDRKHPIRFDLGSGTVIKGWDDGIPGMKVGGVRQLKIPPQLGYGWRGAPPAIPPNSTLIFQVYLVAVQ